MELRERGGAGEWGYCYRLRRGTERERESGRGMEIMLQTGEWH